MTRRWALVLQALGLAVIYGTPLIYPLIDAHYGLVYHLHDSPSRLFAPVLIDVLLLTALLYGLLRSIARPGRRNAMANHALLLGAPALLYAEARLQLQLPFNGMPLKIYAAAAAAVLLGIALRRETWAGCVRLTQTVFLFAGLSGMLVLLQLTYCWFASRSLGKVPQLHARATPAGAPGGRVVWLVLDELSEDQAFTHRYAGLDLPSLDALAAQSTRFAEVVPAGSATEEVLPALLTGSAVDAIQRSAAGELVAIHDAKRQQWRRFEPSDTVFADALRAGYSTSVDGWYNPYCRMLAPVLDQCEWRFHLARVLPMRPDLSITQNALQPLLSVAGFVSRMITRSRKPNAERASHLDDYLELREAARRSLADPAQTFLLIHMPVPHPLAIFNRRTGQMDTHWGSYLDNLKLADIYLGEVEAQLQRQGEWESATVVVMGDHSWRMRQIWNHSQMWTAEDERASRGERFDSRPAYLVKLPGQRTANRTDCRFAALRTRPLLDGLLLHQFSDATSLESWACRQ